MRYDRNARLAGLALVIVLSLPTRSPAQMMGGGMGGMMGGNLAMSPALRRQLGLPDPKPAKPRPVVVSAAAAKTWIKLDQAVTLPFENETPLAEVIKYIKNATSSGAGDPGIPIYVNPTGLQEQDRTMESTVVLNLEGVPLATTLRLMLKQLDLTYFVQKDGLLIIDSVQADPPRDRVAPLSEKAARAWIRLSQTVDVPFENETPLSDVLAFVRSSLAEPRGPGVPIFVNPAGLQAADRSPESPVTLKIEGVPLAQSLRMLLEQLGLDYFVNDDGVLVVTNKDAEVFADLAAEADATPFEAAVEALKAEVASLRSKLDELRKAQDGKDKPRDRKE